jgi:hypothetical protein
MGRGQPGQPDLLLGGGVFRSLGHGGQGVALGQGQGAAGGVQHVPLGDKDLGGLAAFLARGGQFVDGLGLGLRGLGPQPPDPLVHAVETAQDRAPKSSERRARPASASARSTARPTSAKSWAW